MKLRGVLNNEKPPRVMPTNVYSGLIPALRRNDMNRSTAAALSVLMLLFAFAASASAQPSTRISSGQRVRIITDSGEHVGTVAAVTTDNVRLSDASRETTIAFAGVRRIDVSAGRESKWKKYALRGAIISGAIGAISLGLQHDTVGENGSSVGTAAALGVWSGGLFGGLIGGAIGATKSADHWQTVWP
jgi:hypothetical protein